MKNLSLQWTSHLKDPQDKKNLEASIRASTLALGTLRSILIQRLENLQKEETTIGAYENSAWAYKQAHQNGVKRSIRDVLELLAFLE
jgi:hypothetical protein